MDLGLQGQVYVVTGGSGGLGRATAEALVADGADPGTPAVLVDAARSTYGRLDGALISVGGPAAGTLMDTPDEDWAAAIESVFLGGLRLGREIGRELEAGGSIAYVLSSSVKSPIAGL